MSRAYIYNNNYYLMRDLEKSSDKIKIAVIEEEDAYYSSTPRALDEMQQEFPEIEIFVIEAKEVCEEIIEKVDAVIMPGGLDHFPRRTFSKDDFSETNICRRSWDNNCISPREAIYQKLNQWVQDKKIPSMGICLGHQFLALHYGSKIGRVSTEYRWAYDVNAHFVKGTLPYLYTLSNEEQKQAYQTCSLPEISFKDIYVNHSYKVEKDDQDLITVGAIHNDGTIESISSGDKHTGFQFHFEATLHDNARYKNIFRNFIHAAEQHHEAVKASNNNAELLKKNLQIIEDNNNSFIKRIEKCAQKHLNVPHPNFRGAHFDNKDENLEPLEDSPYGLYSIPAFHTDLAPLAY